MENEPDKVRADLLQQLTAQDSVAAEIEAIGKQYVQSAREIRDISRPMKKIVAALPDDAIMSSEMMQYSNGLREWDSVANGVLGFRTMCNTFSVACSGVANTANETAVFFDDYLATPQLAKAKKELFDVQESIPQAEKVKLSMARLGLDSRLLDEAIGALRNPVHGAGGPVSVLIPLRECINEVLDSILKRRPAQEDTNSKAHLKVESIGRQCALPTLPAGHFQRLAAESGPLLNELSGAKGRAFSRDEIRVYLIRGLGFLVAFVGGIDESRLRPAK